MIRYRTHDLTRLMPELQACAVLKKSLVVRTI